MTTTYEANGAIWYSERDDWEHGCVEPFNDGYTDERLSADTLDELFVKIRRAVSFDPANAEMVLNPLGENDGRIDIGGTTNDLDDGTSWATADEMEEWKRGERDLYYTVWTFHVEKVTREPVAFEMESSPPG